MSEVPLLQASSVEARERPRVLNAWGRSYCVQLAASRKTMVCSHCPRCRDQSAMRGSGPRSTRTRGSPCALLGRRFNCKPQERPRQGAVPHLGGCPGGGRPTASSQSLVHLATRMGNLLELVVEVLASICCFRSAQLNPNNEARRLDSRDSVTSLPQQ